MDDPHAADAVGAAVAQELLLRYYVPVQSDFPVWNWVSPAGRDITWSDILTIQSVAAATLPQPVRNAAPSNAPAPNSVGTISAPSEERGAATTPPPSNMPVSPPAATPPQAQVSSVSPGPTTMVVAPVVAKTEAELFGDQLQALSSLYESLITVLAVGLGLLAAIGFAAIRFASMREAENMARRVFDGDDHRAFVTAQIAKGVEAQWKEVASEFRELQDRVDALSELLDEKVEVPKSATVPAEQTRPPATPLPTPSTSVGTASGRGQAAAPVSASAAATPVPPLPPAGARAVDVSTPDQAVSQTASGSGSASANTIPRASQTTDPAETSDQTPHTPESLPPALDAHVGQEKLAGTLAVEPASALVQSGHADPDVRMALDDAASETGTEPSSTAASTSSNTPVNPEAVTPAEHTSHASTVLPTPIGVDQAAAKIPSESAGIVSASPVPTPKAGNDDSIVLDQVASENSTEPSATLATIDSSSQKETAAVEPDSQDKDPNSDDKLETGN